MRLKKGDTVIVITGRDKGKKGKIIRVNPTAGKVVVERVNVAKKHQRPTRNFQGGIIEKPMPLAAGKVMIVCPQCSRPTRVGIKLIEERNLRACKKCGELIDKR